MTDDYLLSAEFIENRIEILRSRDLEIPEFHAMQLPLANLLRALLTQRNAADERARRLEAALRAEVVGGSDAYIGCALCSGGWRYGEPEAHTADCLLVLQEGGK